MSNKLRLIYDLMDAENYKGALKTCQASLAKSDSQIVRALKAVALDRLNRPGEALDVACQLAGENPKDNVVVPTVFLVFKTHRMWKIAHTMYFKAIESSTSSEVMDLGKTAYLLAALVKDWEGMAQMAIRLYKASGQQTQFIQWLCQAVLLELQSRGERPVVGETKVSDKTVMLMKLMLKKDSLVLTAKPFQETEFKRRREVWSRFLSRFSLFARLGDLDECERLLASAFENWTREEGSEEQTPTFPVDFTSLAFDPSDLLQLKGYLKELKGEDDKAVEVFREAAALQDQMMEEMEVGPSEAYLNYLFSASCQPATTFQALEKEVTQKWGKTKEGMLLNLKLCLMFLGNDKKTTKDLCERFESIVVSFISMFSGSFTCALEILPFCAALEDDAAASILDLCQEFFDTSVETSHEVPAKVLTFARLWYALRRRGRLPSIEDDWEKARTWKRLVDLWKCSDKNENVLCAQQLLLLSISLLLDVDQSEVETSFSDSRRREGVGRLENRVFLVEALTWLEEGALKWGKEMKHFNFLQVVLYSALGNSNRSSALFSGALDMKNAQLKTLVYSVLPGLAREACLLPPSKQVWKSAALAADVLEFSEDYGSEMVDMLMMSFNEGAYHRSWEMLAALGDAEKSAEFSLASSLLVLSRLIGYAKEGSFSDIQNLFAVLPPSDISADPESFPTPSPDLAPANFLLLQEQAQGKTHREVLRTVFLQKHESRRPFLKAATNFSTLEARGCPSSEPQTAPSALGRVMKERSFESSPLYAQLMFLVAKAVELFWKDYRNSDELARTLDAFSQSLKLAEPWGKDQKGGSTFGPLPFSSPPNLLHFECLRCVLLFFLQISRASKEGGKNHIELKAAYEGVLGSLRDCVEFSASFFGVEEDLESPVLSPSVFTISQAAFFSTGVLLAGVLKLDRDIPKKEPLRKTLNGFLPGISSLLSKWSKTIPADREGKLESETVKRTVGVLKDRLSSLTEEKEADALRERVVAEFILRPRREGLVVMRKSLGDSAAAFRNLKF